MKFLEIVGIDVSKNTIDVQMHVAKLYNQFDNNSTGFRKLLKWVKKGTKISFDEILFIFEHTGLYSHQLALFFSDKQLKFKMVSGLEVKKSLGIARGKSDKIDAAKIALFGYRRRDELKTTKLLSIVNQRLKPLLSLRERLVKEKAGYQASYKEMKKVFVVKDNQLLFDTQQKMIKYTKKQIAAVEKEMRSILREDEELSKQFDLITSVKGVGEVTAFFLIVYTDGFSKFPNWRKLASYSGTAPFPYQSGSSIKGKTKVSHYANKRLKSLLSSCASSAVRYNTELRLYFQKKIEEGKEYFSVLNAIRNKLLARIFAVVQRGTPYVNYAAYAGN